jgi:AcrR family transcriptional regulator
VTTRDRILDAALACFTARGIAGTTVAALREASGVSTGSLYHHFPSKEQLALGLYLQGISSYHAGALALFAPTPDPRVGVEALVRHHLGWVSEQPDMARYLLNTRQAEIMEGAEEAIAAENRDFLRRLFAWLDPAIAAGSLRPMPPDLYLPLIIGPSHEFARHWLADRVRTPLLDASVLLIQAAWASVRPRTRET